MEIPAKLWCRGMSYGRKVSPIPVVASDPSSIGESSASELCFGVAASVGIGAIMYWSSCGTVWLRGRCELPLPVAGKIRRGVCGGMATKGAAAVPESGVKNGEVGLRILGEKQAVEVAMSVKTVEMEGGLFRLKLLWSSEPSCLTRGDDDNAVSSGDPGEALCGD